MKRAVILVRLTLAEAPGRSHSLESAASKNMSTARQEQLRAAFARASNVGHIHLSPHETIDMVNVNQDKQ